MSYLKIFILIFFLFFKITTVFPQFNFKIDTVYFKGQYVDNVSLGIDGNVWVIKNENRSGIGKVDKQGIESDISAVFYGSVHSKFTDILGLDNDTVWIGTENDYLIQYSRRGLQHADGYSLVGERGINSLVGIRSPRDNGDFFAMIGTDSSLYISYWLNHQQRFMKYSGNWNIKAKYHAWYADGESTIFDFEDSATIPRSNLAVVTSQTSYLNYNTKIFPLQPYYSKEKVNSYAITNGYYKYSFDLPNLYWGSNYGLTKVEKDPFGKGYATYYLQKRIVNKIYPIEYFKNSVLFKPFIFIATDSGLYLNYPHVYKGKEIINGLAAMPGKDSIVFIPQTYGYQIFDIDGNTCDSSLWLATNKGLLRLQFNNNPAISYNKSIVQNALQPSGEVKFCKQNQISLSAKSALEYQWLRNKEIIPGANTSIYQTNIPGDYQVILTDIICDDVTKDTTFATTLSYDSTVNFSFSYPDTVLICQGESQQLEVTFSGEISFDWYLNGKPLTKYASTISTTDSGFYKVKVFNCNGLFKFSDSVYVKIIPAPQIKYIADNLCEGDSLKLSVPKIFKHVTWYMNNLELLNFRDKTEIFVNSSGEFLAGYSENFSCNSISKPIQINAHTKPEIALHINKPLPICAGDSVALTALGSPALYSWSNGQGYPTIQVKESGLYKVKALDEFDCVNYDSLMITVIPQFNSFIPNLITPNEDQRNELFYIDQLTPNSSLTIYNSWGSSIYENSNYQNDWKANNVAEGIYYYYLKNNFCHVERKGWIQITR